MLKKGKRSVEQKSNEEPLAKVKKSVKLETNLKNSERTQSGKNVKQMSFEKGKFNNKGPQKGKRSIEQNSNEEPSEKIKKSVKFETNLKNSEVRKESDKNVKQKSFEKGKFNNKGPQKGKPFNKNQPYQSGKPFNKNFQNPQDTKPPNWNEYKQKKKELQLKRKVSKNSYDVVVQVKKIGENLRRKTLKGGEEERKKMTEQIHNILVGNGHYSKLVMTHDMARIIQYLLKYGSEKIQNEIAEELKSVVVDMLQSKYAKYCVKHMLKNGKAKIHSEIIQAMYGNAVKLASHAVSAPIFNDAFATYANPLQKQHLIQEFYGDMFKQSKEDSIKHLKDVYEKSTDMKTAALGATKANLQRILNKQLLDSHLVQTVLMQFLQECTKEDRSELISQLAPHVAVLSNSKEGARVVMNCIWHGTNKDRKVIIKTLKEHVIPLSKHEHGYCSILTLIDSTDDTLLVNKAILTEIVKNAGELVSDEWGRKVLLWLVAPGNTTYFHPVFTNELKVGRENSGSKKDADIRYKEILNYVLNPLLKQIAEEPQKWFANSCIVVVTAAILKAGTGDELEKAFEALATLITDENWKIKEGEKETVGVENAGLHMILKKIIQNDKCEEDKPKFGAVLIKHLTDDVVKNWIQYNRGCFLLINTIESNFEEVQNQIKQLLKPHKKLLKKSNSAGSKLLVQKLR